VDFGGSIMIDLRQSITITGLMLEKKRKRKKKNHTNVAVVVVDIVIHSISNPLSVVKSATTNCNNRTKQSLFFTATEAKTDINVNNKTKNMLSLSVKMRKRKR